MEKSIAVLGSTGSIGTQTLEVLKGLEGFSVKGLTTNVSIDLLEKQIHEFNPKKVAVMNEEKALELKKRLVGKNVEVLTGIDGIIEIATMDEVDTVVNSVVGNIGLEPTVRAIRAKKNIALANKETLVTAGELVMKEVEKNGVCMYPVDSEHSAIFQCLQGNKQNKIKKIHLTASGGPFRGRKNLAGITVEQALKHPNWSMGKKITIDSATLMNKGLEVIEAKWLFDVNTEQINVVVHPQSIIHSMVEYEDGAIIAQLGTPDMRLPIQYALTYPKRVKNDFERLDFFSCSDFTFEKPDMSVFRCLALAFDAIKIGGTMPAVLNAANEVAVDKFLKREIQFSDISKLIEKAMNAYNVKYNYLLDDVFEADRWARQYVNNII